MRTAQIRAAIVFWVFSAAAVAAQVLTTQYDKARSGAALNETALTPATVNVNRFGKVFTYPVDGDVYAQPLYVPRVAIPDKGVHDVVFVATEHDSVYAFDAAGRPAEPLWHVSFLDSAKGITTVSARDAECPFISPEIGITPTPVIDLKSGTLYVLARTRQRSGLTRTTFSQQLHALAITTGVEKFGGPVEIQARGFDPLRQLPRAGLLLTDGQLYLTWASSCDVEPYHGWVMTYDASTLKQTGVLNVSPDGREAGIWQSDNGPAADEAGHVYVATGNGTFDAPNGGHDYGDSLLELTASGGQLHVDDFFTPPDQSELAARDLDLGSGGPLLVPDRAAAGGGLVLVGGKDGKLRVLDRHRLGHGKSEASQVIRFKGGIYSTPAYWNGRVYVLAGEDTLKAFAVAAGESLRLACGQRHGGVSEPRRHACNLGRRHAQWNRLGRRDEGLERLRRSAGGTPRVRCPASFARAVLERGEQRSRPCGLDHALRNPDDRQRPRLHRREARGRRLRHGGPVSTIGGLVNW